MIVVILLFSCVLNSIHGLAWNDFRVTWRPTPNSGFTRQPKTEPEAIKQGWSKLPGATCQNGGTFNGIRYRKGTDNSLILIYNVKGDIAGVQMWIPEAEITKNANNSFRFKDVHYFVHITQDGKAYFVLTAYFENPGNICKKGVFSRKRRSTTATGVWIQKSSRPTDVLQIPAKRTAALKAAWSNNACFPGMGVHSFYRMEAYQASSCNLVDPVFGLYNHDGDLHGFGFVTVSNIVNANFENNSPQGAALVSGTIAPQCLKPTVEKSGLTTMHVYFIDRPWEFKCPAAPATSSGVKQANSKHSSTH